MPCVLLTPWGTAVESGIGAEAEALRDGATGVAPTGEAGARSRSDRKVTKSATVEKATMMKKCFPKGYCLKECRYFDKLVSDQHCYK